VKKFIVMCAVILMASTVSGQDLWAIMVDSIVGADTAAETERWDTVYSSVINLEHTLGGSPSRVQFYVTLGGLTGEFAELGGTDTAFADDTFWIDLEHSYDQSTWAVKQVDTLLAEGTGYGTDLVASATNFGDYARLRVIHYDSLGADTPGVEDNAYRWLIKVWLSLIY
jgi:hypothetical protein